LEHHRDFDVIEQHLSTLLACVRAELAIEPGALVDEFIAVGEYGLAFESICFDLDAAPRLLSDDVIQRVRELSKMMGIEISQWPNLLPDEL
jgi:hypothetical protein